VVRTNSAAIFFDFYYFFQRSDVNCIAVQWPTSKISRALKEVHSKN